MNRGRNTVCRELRAEHWEEPRLVALVGFSWALSCLNSSYGMAVVIDAAVLESSCFPELQELIGT